MVHCAGDDDCLQWRYGIHVWILFWQNAIDQAKSKENLGGIYRRRICHCHFWCGFLILPLSLSILCVSNRVFGDSWQNSIGLRAKLFIQTTRIWNSNCKTYLNYFWISILIYFFINIRVKLKLFSQCIRTCYIPYRWVSSVQSSVRLADFSHLDLNVHLKLR